MSHSGTPKMKCPVPRIDASSSILDAHASNSKQLLNAYIYDFLIKSRLPQTARLFVTEADVPTSPNPASVLPGGDFLSAKAAYLQFQKENNLPQLAMAMDAPQGFLFEWWLVFWDVFQAKNNRGLSQMAMQYYQLQMMKQKQQEAAGANPQPNMYGVQNPQHGHGQPQDQPQGASQQLDPQQQRMMMQMMMKQQNMPVMLEQQLQMLGPQLQQQVFLQKQQQRLGLVLMPGQPQLQPGQPGVHPQMSGSQSYQPQPQNRIQQHAQNQMNNLRHQAAVAAQQQFQTGDAGSPGSMPRMSQATPQNGQQSMAAILPFQQHMGQPGSAQGNARANSAHQNGAPAPNIPNGNHELANGARNADPNRNINALQDYQMQLMLLEKQNKKRLDIARNNGTSDFSLISVNNNANNMNMLPPNGGAASVQKASPGVTGGSGSPSITKAPSPGSNGAKKKKERPAKRTRKASTSSVTQDQPTSTGVSDQSNNLKKDYTTPLTPSSETPNEPATKKKKKSAESPKKSMMGPGSKTDKRDKESGSFEGDHQSNYEASSSDQMFPILGGNTNGENHMFGNGSNGGGLDDIDFDFNLFLDSGADSNMHDGVGFNWSNVDAIEGSEL